MRILVACEFSGVVREAFLARGHDAYSCGILPSNHLRATEGRHLQQDVTPLLRQSWDLVIAHPFCTYLANSGVRWFKDDPVGRKFQMQEGAEFFKLCLNANALRVCVENPIMHKYAIEAVGGGPTYADHTAVAVRARRDESDVSMAQRSA